MAIDKLSGRLNYRTWSMAMRAYLQSEELWDTIKAPAEGQLSEDPKKIDKARGKIILAVEPDIYPYLEDAESAKDAWEILAKTFDDPGASSKVNLLVEISTTRYENCKSMEDYVARMIGTSKKLNTIGTQIPTDLIGALMLAGLPPSFKPMVMALTNSGQNLTADFIKTKLLEEAQSQNSSNGHPFENQNVGLHAQAHSAQFSSQGYSNRGRNATHGRNGSRANSKIRCYNCNRFGHISKKCKAPKRNSDSNACTAATDDESAD